MNRSRVYVGEEVPTKMTGMIFSALAAQMIFTGVGSFLAGS